jgi:hypothetical protein
MCGLAADRGTGAAEEVEILSGHQLPASDVGGVSGGLGGAGVSRGGGVAEDEVSPAGELAFRHPYPSRFNV